MKTQKILINSRVLCFLGLLLLLTPGMANAAVFTVNSTADAVAANPAGGVCETAPGNGICTLRAAIQVANASAATADTINVPPGTYTLTIAGLGENAAATGDLDITGVLAANALTIGGTGLTPAATIIDGGGIDRVFDIIGVAPVTISNLTIRNGNPGAAANGGAIATAGAGRSLSMTNVVITANTAGVEGGAIDIGAGGAAVSMENVAITNNVSPGAGGIALGAGSTLTITNGTISGNNDSGLNNQGTATLTNVTFSGNTTVGNGGAIDNRGIVNLQNCTINGNTAPLPANIGGIRVIAGTVSLRNTIISNNTAVNCGGAFTSQGNNLASDATCGLNALTDIVNTPPQLGPLADNGGPLLTHALLAGSPAIDKGTATGCPAADARGIARPVDGNIPLDGVATCDMGAFEFRPQKITVTLPSPFDFGAVTLAANSNHVITLSNAGDGDLAIGAIATANPLAAPFTKPVDTCSGVTLPRAGTCTFTARFTPTVVAPVQDTFDIPSNDPATPTVAFVLNGLGTTALVPVVTVTDTIAPANDANLPFGNIPIGTTADATVTLTNTGTASIVIGTIASINPLAAPFSITADLCSGKTITVSGTCTFTVHFAPTANTAVTDIFDVPTSEVDQSSVPVHVSGGGIAATGNNPPAIPNLVSPTNGQAGMATTVTLSWNRAVDPDGDSVSYKVVTCTSQDFTGCTPVDVAAAASALQIAGVGGVSAGIVLIGLFGGRGLKRNRKAMLFISVLLLTGVIFTACGGGGGDAGPGPASTAGDVQFTASGLSANTTYFWRVLATDQHGAQATSDTFSFKTQ